MSTRKESIWHIKKNDPNWVKEFPHNSMYEYLRDTAQTHLNACAIEFEGKTTSYKKLLQEIDFVARDDKNLYYIQVAYTLSDPDKNEQEVSSFYGLDDGYKKIVITMDDDPFVNLKNGYKKINVFDFLLNDNILEEI